MEPLDIVAEIVKLNEEIARLDLKLKIQSDLLVVYADAHEAVSANQRARIAKLEASRTRHLHWTDMGR